MTDNETLTIYVNYTSSKREEILQKQGWHKKVVLYTNKKKKRNLRKKEKNQVKK